MPLWDSLAAKRLRGSQKSLPSVSGMFRAASNSSKNGLRLSLTNLAAATGVRSSPNLGLSVKRKRLIATTVRTKKALEIQLLKPSANARAGIPLPKRTTMSPNEIILEFSQPFVHKRLTRAIGGFISGGPTGAVSGFFAPGGGRRASPQAIHPPSIGRSSPFRSRTSLPVVPAGGLRARIERLVPGGATGLEVSGGAVSGGCPQGFHPNKSDYMTAAGFVPEGSKCVKNRRRNLSNGRANTRSLRRMAAWDKQERRLSRTLKAIARGR